MKTEYLILGIVAIAAILVACLFGLSLKRIAVNNKRMSEIAEYIKNGAMAYLGRQYKVLSIFLLVMAVVLAVIPSLGFKMAICFVIGAILSIVAGFFGMRSAVTANVRTAQAAEKGLASAFRVAFTGGTIMGLLVVGLGAIGICIVTIVFDDPNLLTGFSLGASSIALFSRVGGGIYTKAADVGADLVGKVEAGIPEDDPRNPAVIADNVGDNVGDVAGMGADLFESYCGCIVSALLMASLGASSTDGTFVISLVALGIFASLIGVLFVSVAKAKKVQLLLNIGTYVSAVLLVGGSFGLSIALTGNVKYALAVCCGTGAGLLIGQFTEMYTSASYKTVKKIAKSSETGAATNILSGYAAGLKSTVPTILVLALAIYLSYLAGGYFGIVLAALGMLATVGMIISVDAYGPVADNAGGIAEMSGAKHEIREITDHLDSVGNTTAAVGKGFSIGSAALTALALFTTYASTVKLESINLLEPKVIIGLLLGGMLTFLFSALTIESVSKAANKMIEEVRSQFKNHPNILKGTEEPDYKKCVDISTKAAIREMLLPGIIAIVAPILTGLLLGAAALAGLLAGATVTGVLLAVKMANAGGAWDNAKKYIEDGNMGGKGSDAHKAAVTGDTVGDPFKDTSGPSLNILIKLMSIVALVFVPLFI